MGIGDASLQPQSPLWYFYFCVVGLRSSSSILLLPSSKQPASIAQTAAISLIFPPQCFTAKVFYSHPVTTLQTAWSLPSMIPLFSWYQVFPCLPIASPILGEKSPRPLFRWGLFPYRITKLVIITNSLIEIPLGGYGFFPAPLAPFALYSTYLFSSFMLPDIDKDIWVYHPGVVLSEKSWVVWFDVWKRSTG